jgi:hypothetical protein
MADKDMNKPQGGRDDRESGEPLQLDRDKQGGQQMPERQGEGQKGGAQRPEQRPEQQKPDQQRPEQQRPEHQSK